jgi:hypothetical protein
MQYRCAKFITTRYLQSAGERNVMWGKKYKTQSFGKYEKAKAIMLKGRSFGFSGSETMCHGV